MAIIPRRQTFGESFGAGLGQGVSSGIQALANLKLRQMQEQQQASETFKALQGLLPSAPVERLQGISKLPSGLQQFGLKQMMQGPAQLQNLVLSLSAAGKTPDEIEEMYPGLIDKSRNAEEMFGSFGGTGSMSPSQIIEIGQKTKSQQFKEQEARTKQVERHLKPNLDQLHSDSVLAEKALPVLRQMKQVVKQIPQGLGYYLGSDATRLYGNLATQLASILEVKPDAIPSTSLSSAELGKALDEMIKPHESTLLKKDAAEDIVAENNNTYPSDLFKQIDKRLKVRSHQKQKKNQTMSAESYFPHLEGELQPDITPETPRMDTVAGNSQQDDYRQNVMAVQPEEIPDIPFGSTELSQRTPSYAEKLSNMVGSDVMGGPFGAIKRPLAAGVSGVAGGLGDLLSYIPGVGKVLEKSPVPLTSERIEKEVFGSPETQSKPEEFVTNIAREAGSLVGPGLGLGALTKGIGKLVQVPKWLKTATSFLKIAPKAAGAISTAGNSAEALLGEMGASKRVQKLGKFVTSLGTAALTNRFASLQAHDLGGRIAESVKKGKDYTSYKLRDNLRALYRALEKGETTSLKNELMTTIDEIKSIKMPSDKLWKIHGLIDQAKNAPSISAPVKNLLPKLSQQIENGLSYANKNLKPLISDYKDLAKASDMSTKTYQGLRGLLKRSPAVSIPLYILGKSIGATSRPQLIANLGVSGMGAIGLAGELERSLRLMNNPEFKRIYGDVVKAGIGSALRELGLAD